MIHRDCNPSPKHLHALRRGGPDVVDSISPGHRVPSTPNQRTRIMNNADSYEQCNLCHTEWRTLDDLLSDPEVRLNGYQPCFQLPDAGLFLFTHDLDHCHATVALPVIDFQHLYTGSRHTRLMVGDAGCLLHCLNQHDLSPCTNPCAMAWVRHILCVLVQRDAEVIPARIEGQSVT